MAVRNTATSFTTQKQTCSLESRRAHIVDQTPPATSTSGDKSQLTFMSNGTYCWVYYKSNHVTLQYRHLKQDIYFVRPKNSR